MKYPYLAVLIHVEDIPTGWRPTLYATVEKAAARLTRGMRAGCTRGFIYTEDRLPFVVEEWLSPDLIEPSVEEWAK